MADDEWEDVDEIAEIEGEEEDEVEENPPIEDEQSLQAWPARIVMVFTGADTGNGELDDVVNAVIDDAKKRGLFFEWAQGGEMDPMDVIPGSPLYQAVTGRMPAE